MSASTTGLRMDAFTTHKETRTMIGSTIRTAVTVTACTLGACFALFAPSAGAKVIHQQEGSFNGADRPLFEAFSDMLPSDAVDLSNGDVWVTEGKVFGFYGKTDAIDKFNAKGEYAGVQLTGSNTPQNEFAFGVGFYPGIAVDNTAAGPHKGDLYVADIGNGVVDRFSSAGAFECQITGKTPSTPEEQGHECNGATGSLTPDGSIEPAGLAVDSSGDVYVADRAHAAIDIFTASGAYKEHIKDSHLTNVGIIALDTTGNLYVTNFAENVVEFESHGVFVKTLNQAKAAKEVADNPAGVSVDPANNNVYVGIDRENAATQQNEGAIAEYEPSGVLLDIFGSRQFTFGTASFAGLAVGPSGKLYAAEFINTHGANVQIYSPDIVIPNVNSQAATGVEESSAVLNGHVDPDAQHGGGEVMSCRFEYGPTTAYGETASCAPGAPYAGPQDVSAHVTGLRASSTYHFRLEAANANAIASTSEDETLTTPGPPSVDWTSAQAEATRVTFRARINPWGHDTTCQVEYVPDASFQQSKWANATTIPCAREDLGAGFGDVFVTAHVTGLTKATAYHYRFLATNQSGISGSPDRTFETFNIESFSIEDRNRAGEPETQAGGHPYEVITNLELNRTLVYHPEVIEREEEHTTGVNTKDIRVGLPPGLIGNPTAVPKCNRYLVEESDCPGESQIGIIEIWTGQWEASEGNYRAPLFNLQPSGHQAAEFGGLLQGLATAWIKFHVRTGSDYGVSADSLDISALDLVRKVRVNIWGVPADVSHQADRRCPTGKQQYKPNCFDPEQLKPLLTNPTACAGPQTATAQVDSWQEPGNYLETEATLPAFTGCGKLPFAPTLEALPTTNVADAPSGLHLDLHIPQPQGCKEENGSVVCEDAEADLRDATVTLPAGVTIDPSAADGLQACSEAQIGYLPEQSAKVGRPQFTPDPAECPDAAKIGKVEVGSPLVDHPLPGAVYIATQDANPFKSSLAMYVAVYDAQTGVVIKLPGKVTADPVTGQLTTTFGENPQLPFEDFKLDLFSGSRASSSRAVLTTPLSCGSYSVGTVLTPWSAPEGKDAEPSSLPFSVTGAGGSACVNSEAQAPNTPGFEAGTASPVAASYSPFVLRLSRDDGSQRFSALNVTLPPGLIGKVAGLAECSQADIEAAFAHSHEGEGAVELAHPSCPVGSEIGIVHVGAGSGAPFYETGHAYFAGPYKGAPFSIVIVTPAVAGPFDLGTVVVRAALYIDRNTAQVTVKSDPFPTILDGIPLDIRNINVDMDRKEFTFNPTSCSVMSVTGQEMSTTGQTAGLSDRFQAGSCTTLPFHPVFEASASSASTRKEGASLIVHVSSSAGQANISKVKVTLPKQLPSRLETLKGACVESVFAANPASCPAGSAVGTAIAHTPILNSPLSGPVYIVSHGGATFPDVEAVLQGEGVTIILDGKTNIQNGITESSFESVPDAPVSTFEMSLPEGAHSILAAPEGLCSSATRTVLVKKKVTVKVKRHGRVQKKRVTRTVKKTVAASLAMPTVLQAQNGAVITQNTAIAITGCATATVKHKAKGHAKPKKRKTGKAGKKTGKRG